MAQSPKHKIIFVNEHLSGRVLWRKLQLNSVKEKSELFNNFFRLGEEVQLKIKEFCIKDFLWRY